MGAFTMQAIGRALLVLLAGAMFLWGLGAPLLALAGKTAEGRVTEIRRQLGDRGEAIPNRYAFQISYRFALPDGSVVQGSTQQIGDYFSPARFRVGQRVVIRYLPLFPWINVADWRWGQIFEHLIVAAVGVVLIYLVVFRNKGRASKRVKAS